MLIEVRRQCSSDYFLRSDLLPLQSSLYRHISDSEFVRIQVENRVDTMAGDNEEVRGVNEATSSEVTGEETEETSKVAGEEEDTGAQIAPIVKLEEVAISTGEENEDVLIDL